MIGITRNEAWIAEASDAIRRAEPKVAEVDHAVRSFAAREVGLESVLFVRLADGAGWN